MTKTFFAKAFAKIAKPETFFTMGVEKFESPVSFFTRPETFFVRAVENFVVRDTKNAAYKTNFAKSNANFTKLHVNFAKGLAKNVNCYVNFVFEGNKERLLQAATGESTVTGEFPQNSFTLKLRLEHSRGKKLKRTFFKCHNFINTLTLPATKTFTMKPVLFIALLQLSIASFAQQPTVTNFDSLMKVKASQILGKPFPTFTAVNEQSTINNDSLKGKVVLINFWFEGCHPCRAEFGALNE
ncbi:MAG: TlpA family protein disulfide reductase, partial [Flavisolibacter sp.]